ncbi:MAG TPA: class I SAM-dependent methyltransferase [Candidatus Acidoferrales bacterium]|nr:class I SAM-dependent methyltransferase [Candidatus Acidoferrales bacterium]
MNRCSDHIAHYEADAELFDYFNNLDETGRAYEVIFRKFIKRLAGKTNSILDVGSGSGWTGEIAHEQIFFVDLSHKNLQVLRPNSSGAVLADACLLPFKTGSLSLVIASEIMEHLNSPGSAAEEIWRVLGKGGKAIVSTPYRERLRYTLCIHCNQATPVNAHLHTFDRKTLLSFFPDVEKRSYLFGSKLLVLLRAPRLFYKLPLWIWRSIDYPLTKFLDKSDHIVVVLEK